MGSFHLIIATFLLRSVYIHVAVPCLKIAISKTLGYGIVVGSAMSELRKNILCLLLINLHALT